METYVLIALVSLLVGACIGICGVAGFLLPIFFLESCGYTASESLFLSFCCFLASGALGSWRYNKQGEYSAKAALPLGLSSLAGSVLGAIIGSFFVAAHVRTVLYSIVLLSGIMIFVQEMLRKKQNAGQNSISKAVLIPLGFLTAVICSMSGAGGPVLVMPLLVVLGMTVRAAVGTALFDSVFIAIPAIFVYGAQSLHAGMILPLVIALVSHSAGILLGTKVAPFIPQKILKYGIAVFSIVFSIWMLIK